MVKVNRPGTRGAALAARHSLPETRAADRLKLSGGESGRGAVLMDGADTTIEGPVSLVVTREVKPGSAAAYEGLIGEIGEAARGFDPNLSMTVIKSEGDKGNQYVVVLHLTSHEALEEWERSDVRAEFRRRLEPLEQEPASFKEVTGFEYWFSLPRIAAIKPPARYKMALITMLGIYIVSVSYTYTIDRWLTALPDHLGLIIRIVVLIIVMTFLVMPLLSRLFARWLYPRSSRAGEAGIEA